MWKALDGPPRFIATLAVSKHRVFAWLDTRICPDHALIAILHSRFHEAWSLRLGTSLEDRPRYTFTTTFETFPFPKGLSPDIPPPIMRTTRESPPSPGPSGVWPSYAAAGSTRPNGWTSRFPVTQSARSPAKRRRRRNSRSER